MNNYLSSDLFITSKTEIIAKVFLIFFVSLIISLAILNASRENDTTIKISILAVIVINIFAIIFSFLTVKRDITINKFIEEMKENGKKVTGIVVGHNNISKTYQFKRQETFTTTNNYVIIEYIDPDSCKKEQFASRQSKKELNQTCKVYLYKQREYAEFD